MNNAAIVTVRNSSTRLPNKAIMNVTKELKAIDIVLKRAKKNNVQIFRGSLLNKIKRWFECFNKFGIDSALLVDGDDLSYNYDIGKRAILELNTQRVDLITHPKDIVTGFFTYAISKKGIDKLYSIAKSEEINTDVITKFIEKTNLTSSLIQLENFEKNENVRFTLDYEEDLEFFRRLYKGIGVESNGKEILEYLEFNKDLIQINFHRQKEFLENQAKFNATIK